MFNVGRWLTKMDINSIVVLYSYAQIFTSMIPETNQITLYQKLVKDVSDINQIGKILYSLEDNNMPQLLSL